jgi:hypothetical protein
MRAWTWSRNFGSVLLFSIALSLLGASAGQAVSLDFETLSHGEVVKTGVGDVQIDALNPNRGFDLAVGFDTSLSGTADTDLEMGGGWSSGNIAGEQLGTILILQENDMDCDTGFCSSPDDEGRRPAGELSFAFRVSVLDFGLDLVDIDDALVEDGSLEFFDGETSVAISFTEFIDPKSAFYDETIEFGDNSANRIAPVSAKLLGLEQIDGVTVNLGGSGGVDNLTGTIVPEPSTAILSLLGLIGLASVGRRC